MAPESIAGTETHEAVADVVTMAGWGADGTILGTMHFAFENDYSSTRCYVTWTGPAADH